MPDAADLELSLRAAGGGEYAAELRFLPPGGAAEAHLVAPPPPAVRLDAEALAAVGVAADPVAYGARLTAALFADPRLREGLGRARALAAGAGAPLRVRLRLDAGDPALHALAWETLQDPDASTAPAAARCLFTSEATPLSRYLDSPDLAPVERRPRAALRALVAVANPTDLAAYRLAPLDTAAEVARLRGALGGVSPTVLGRGTGGPAATLAKLAAALREGPDVLCLVCHGTLLRDGSGLRGEPYLWLEREDGAAERVAGAALVDALRDLPRRPALVVLAACQSAGRPDEAGALSAVGPALAGAGVGAVVAMQGDLTQATAERLLPVLFAELWRDGRIDRALAAARAGVRDRPDWWAPVLFLRLRDGRLWTAPAARPGGTPTDERARRDRQRMLARVRKTWISGVLEASLHGAALQALGLEERPEAVPDRWELVVQEAEAAPRPLPPGTPVADVFDGCDGELLLLGAPGAGKTTLLLELARTLLDRAARDEALPIPVVFPLSTWAARRPPLAEWLVGELAERYDVPRAVGAAWVADERVLPLLDGLDEVRAEHRAACVGAINAYREGRRAGLASLAVCSRTADYEALGARLQLRGAVLLQPLTPAQADAYLASAGPRLAALRAALPRDPTLAELAASPLLLSLLALTYQDAPAAALPTGGRAGDRRAQLFAAYVERMFARRGADPRHPKAQTIRWLAWLAGAMTRQGQTVFYLERLQPDWLPTPALRRRYALTDRVGAGLGAALLLAPPFGLAAGLDAGLDAGPGAALAFGLAFGLGAGPAAGLLGGGPEARFGDRWRLREIVRDAALAFLVTGLGGALMFGLLFGRSDGLLVLLLSWLFGALPFGLAGALAGALAGGPGVRPRHIAPVETIRWSFSHARSSAIVGLGAGLVVGPLFGLAVALAGALAGGLFLTLQLADGPGAARLGVLAVSLGGALGGALAGALLFGLPFGLLGGLARGGVEDEQKAVPNQGIHRSARAAVSVGVAGGLLLGLAGGLPAGLLGGLDAGLFFGLLLALPFGLAIGLAFGGYACLSHAALRVVLWRSGALPLDCVRFLDSAAERILLRRAGGGYLFVHRLLQEHFAALGDAGPTDAPEAPATARDREPLPP